MICYVNVLYNDDKEVRPQEFTREYNSAYDLFNNIVELDKQNYHYVCCILVEFHHSIMPVVIHQH